MFLIGGMNDTMDLNDVWVLKPERKQSCLFVYCLLYVAVHRSCSQVSHVMQHRDHMSWLPPTQL